MIGKVQSGELTNNSNSVGSAYNYFARATGREQEQAGAAGQGANRFPGLSGRGADTTDRIKLSHEALFGSLAGDNNIGKQDQAFSLESFRSNIGLTPPDKNKSEIKEGEEGKSLWEKLEMLSMKTAGQGW
ncbi:MAG: hypothetical protein LWY06_06920 [Firmicutes bacterium]|nr:hypothetical protein [Bacillota bacterium]